ncbi:Dimethylmenaquinone methyltransferase [Pseudomonas syringae pv. philadelphi]|uniref:Putative 4-hydroxy-4-methyl-2-oxoglutarate aldolase n=1 Tax=Pseudomonas syringae pv. philadelphi TaxID=251706 RepID=A0A3M3Z4W5_9PSED|nr:RraA family protein [Pseudomonas syringae group genomosp. 3]RMO88995.1 Dimethylmenaquinone methyltransferase [Pseudomonas syringae pv. philadelphi]
MSALSESVSISQALLNECEHLDTASLSDALDSLGINGGLAGIASQVPGTRCVGIAFTVQYEPVDTSAVFKGAANYIDQVPAGAVIVSSNNGRQDCTVWGDIMTHFALANGIKGTVIDGVARDIDTVIRCNYPLFSRGRFMQSAKNRAQLRAVQVPVVIDGVSIHPGDLIVCDGSGCVVIPQHIAGEVVRRAQAVEQTERRIIDAISAGSTLEDARRACRYDQPWLTDAEKARAGVPS